MWVWGDNKHPRPRSSIDLEIQLLGHAALSLIRTGVALAAAVRRLADERARKAHY